LVEDRSTGTVSERERVVPECDSVNDTQTVEVLIGDLSSIGDLPADDVEFPSGRP